MRKVVLALSLLTAVGISPIYGKSASWDLMFKTPDMGGPPTIFYVDHHSVRLRGGTLQAWILLDFGHAVGVQESNGRLRYFRSDRSLIFVNCATHRVATAEDVEYREAMGRGESFTRIYPKPLRWNDPQTDALVDRESKILCRKIGIGYVPVPDADATSRLKVAGAVAQMAISPARSDILVAAAVPNVVPKAGGLFGIYTISLRDPEHPRKLGFFPILDPADVVLSPDGLTAYVLAPPRPGYPRSEGYYGLFILSLSDPARPKLLAHVGGLFWSMGLSSNGTALFLQEYHSWWADGSTGPSRIRAYRLHGGLPGTYCTVDLGTPQRNSLLFAYSFFGFVDNTYLGLNSRGAEFLVIDVADPCKPDVISDIVDQHEALQAGWKDARLIGGFHGLVSFRYAKPQIEARLYRSRLNFLSAIHVFNGGATVTGRGANEVFVFGREKYDCFYEARAFHVLDATDEIVGSRSMLYVGGENFIEAMHMSAGQTLAIRGRTCGTQR